MTEDGLTAAERTAIGALPRDAVPPAHLEEATVALLRDKGLLTPMRARRGRRGAQLSQLWRQRCCSSSPDCCSADGRVPAKP